MRFKILNTRDVKKIREKCIEQYGHFPVGDYAYIQNYKEKIFVVNKDLARIDFESIRVDKMGLYFAEIYKEQVRLSKEGTMFLYNNAKENGVELKNVVEITKDELQVYFTGEALHKDLGEEGKFIILKYKEEIIGCTQYKQKTILNFMPKIYRGEAIL